MLHRLLHRPQPPAETGLIAAVKHISSAKFPDPAARAAAIAAVRSGAIIGCYVPAGYRNHTTIEFGGMPQDVDPRTTCAQWCAWWSAGKDPATEHLAEQRALQAAAGAVLDALAAQGGQAQ